MSLSLFQSLASVSAYCYGNQHIMFFEQFSIGVNWENITEGINDEFSFSWIITMLLLDGVLYGIIGWYFSNVLPGMIDYNCKIIHRHGYRFSG